ncbi:hypothetical protein BG004_007707 [Podila humilis]|nr:hypothetical protein BG004_007707 [Podila humilis]
MIHARALLVPARSTIESTSRRSFISTPSLHNITRSYSQSTAPGTFTTRATASRTATLGRENRPAAGPTKFQAAYSPANSSGTVARGSRDDSMWDPYTDGMIIKLHKEQKPWKAIDHELQRPLSSCYHRYYTALDPNLQVLTLPDGTHNIAMLKRLVYLVEQEKEAYGKIESRGLLNGYIVPKPGDPTNPRINKVMLMKMYREYKSKLWKQSLREEQTEISKAVRRSVELYGENWIKVSAHVEAHMAQVHKEKSSGELGSGLSHGQQDQRLTPSAVAELYKKLLKKGVQWGLEDDVVMTRKILQLQRKQGCDVDMFETLASGTATETDPFWEEIAGAVGSHSAEACKERWQGLLELKNEDKSAQSKMWHRFEKYQFWMLWQYHYRSKFSQGLIPNLDQQAPLTEFAKVVEDLSFAKDISRYMRHRNEAKCIKFFMTAVRAVLVPSLPVNAQYEQQQHEPRSRDDQIKAKQAKDSYEQRYMEQCGKFPNRKVLLDTIHGDVAYPALVKFSSFSSANETSMRGDPQQSIVRSDWTPGRVESLKNMVMDAKQGVARADYELDWNAIAGQLEIQERGKYTSAAAADETIHFSGVQCQRCWEYISGMDRRGGGGGGIGKNSFKKGESDDDAAESGTLNNNWSELEIELLQQGVRRHGTSWADIRAQYLPSRNVSELYPKWATLSREERSNADRLKEPDFVGLLSALDKVSK